MTTTRRLAAILAADVAGYSAAMERDEEGTAAAVRALRREVIEPKLAKYQGRLIKTTGDGFLAEFASPIAALDCALDIQQRPAASDGLQLRIGLNLGDVMIIEEGGDVLGEGVNVAARLEALAESGGILVSDKVVREVEGKVQAAFEDRGEQQVKNISKPVRVYAVRTDTLATSGIPELRKALPLPDKPSIAVLPFANMSGDPEQEYFADGMVEEIITALSRFHWLFVIARNSSFTYKGKAIDIKQVGRELGVRYVLEGSVRKAGGRVRITGQLIDASSGIHLWADRFEGSLESVFDLQDQVASGVVGAIDPKLLAVEVARIRHKPVAQLDAYDCFLRATENIFRWTHESNRDALALYYKAIEHDPGYAQAYAGASWCVFFLTQGFTRASEHERLEAERLAREALRLGNDDAVSVAFAGYTLSALALAKGDRSAGEESIGLLDRAITLNPNLARAWVLSGWARIPLGQTEVAIEHVQRAMRLSPLDPAFHGMEAAMARAHLRAARYEEAARWAERSFRSLPTPGAALSLVLSHARLGDLEKARSAAARLQQIAPAWRISTEPYFMLSPPDRQPLILELLRSADLPE